MQAIQQLRSATAPAHDRVDALFGRFDRDDRDGYRTMLLAHARALPAAEAVLDRTAALPAWRPRAPLLAADLADLGAAMPVPAPFDPPGGDAGAWGVLYVTEGSRLGGRLLAQGVGDGLPSRYLAAKHLPGEWRATLAAIDAEAERRGADWLSAACDGALACFALYARTVDAD